MPNYDKFMKLKSAINSLSQMADECGKEIGCTDCADDKSGEEGDSYQENAFDDKEYDDGGQDSAPLKGFNAKGDDESKKKKIGLMAGMLKKKISGMGY